MKTLFDKTVMGGLDMKNRLVRSATGENLATPEGHITEDLLDIYQGLAKGGVGLILLSFTSVAPVDHFNDGLLRLHDDRLIPEYSKLVQEIHSQNCITMPQLALGIYQRRRDDGAYMQIGVNQMNDEDIAEVVQKFVSAAGRAKAAGFDGVQLHGCHGFVLSKFISPSSNHRQDKYGGNVQKRAKVVLDIIDGIRKSVGDIHISIKINGGDLPPEDLLQTCKLLTDAGLGSIEYEGYDSQLVPALQQLTKIPVILTGGHRDMEEMNLLLNQYGVDYFGMSRPLIREEALPNRWQAGDTRPADCVSCGMCMSTYGYRCALTPQKYGKPPRRNR